MFVVFLKKYRLMILVGILFFYLGCGVTLSFMRLECIDVSSAYNTKGKSRTYMNPQYAVLIASGPDNEDKRNAIRATWARFASNIYVEDGEVLYKWNYTWARKQMVQEIIKFYFAIGTNGLSKSQMLKLETEHSENKDLLLLETIKDSYDNLSLKMLFSLKWISDNIGELKYVIKSDDDSFVRIDLLVKDIETFAPGMNADEISEYVSYKKSLPSYKGLYWGYFKGRASVFLKGKWQEQNWFLCDHYLPYAQGGGYVISKSIVDFIANNVDVLSVYNSEDVSMGVWTAALDGINRVHDIRFDTEWKTRGCSKDMLVRHKQTPSDMFQLYKTLVHSHGEKLCDTENTTRKSYRYNWHVLPSKCCK